jgi:uncharacterized membrane protein
VATASAVVLALALAPPFVAPPLRAALVQGFHLVCHQLPERSFAVGGVPLALCHRCLGILAGLGGGTLLVPLLGRWRAALVPAERPLLLLALALAAADWLLGVAGLWANTPASRFLTGVVLGLVAGYLLARSVAAPEVAPEARPAPSFPAAAS